MRIFIILVHTILGYFAGAFLTYISINFFSTITHALALESAMSAIFVGGPLFSVLFLAYSIFSWKRVKK